MKEFLWGKIVVKTIILAAFPLIISTVISIALTNMSISWWIVTLVICLLYFLYLGENCRYEMRQEKHEEWHDAITKLCWEDSSLIKELADALYEKVNAKVGHVEITDWARIKNNCDTVCRIVFEFLKGIALKGDQFSVSVFFKRTGVRGNEYNMISRISYDNHNPASYNVFRAEEEVKSYYYKRLFDDQITRPAILCSKEEIEVAFYNCDGVNYSQYVAIPVACLGNKMIAILQIVSYNDSVIAKDKKSIQKVVDDYLSAYANLILLADKVENVIHHL